jgi:hypothetical protein
MTNIQHIIYRYMKFHKDEMALVFHGAKRKLYSDLESWLARFS